MTQLDRDPVALALAGLPAGARVVVAMSGGVDSSVAAALAARAGYETIGVTLQLYDAGKARRREGACCAGEDIKDARRVAEALGIAHYVLDYEQRFRRAVIDDFADSYLRGETPIPCVRCNQRVKFTDLLGFARELGAAALVTGHYVERRVGRAGAELWQAADPARDQSYFLFATTKDQLDYLRFPLGGLPKPEVRRIAEGLGLAVAAKPDSQDICFVPEGRYTDIVAGLRPGRESPGEIIDLEGRVLGSHDGVSHFTVGQRRGLGLATGQPLHVVRVDAPRRHVVVGPRAALKCSAFNIGDLNWLSADDPMSGGLAVRVKVRSTRPPVGARLRAIAGQPSDLEVLLDDPEEGVAPGQAAVFYGLGAQAGRVLGGGWIARSAIMRAMTVAKTVVAE